jgi:hypothetical protein
VDVLAELTVLRRIVVEQADLIAELRRRLGKNSATSSRNIGPPAVDRAEQRSAAGFRFQRAKSAGPGILDGVSGCLTDTRYWQG